MFQLNKLKRRLSGKSNDHRVSLQMVPRRRVNKVQWAGHTLQTKDKRTMMVLYRSPEQTALHTYC